MPHHRENKWRKPEPHGVWHKMFAQLLLSLQHWSLIVALGQNFDAIFGNGNGMLKLR